jgi:hypothetical protein
LASAVPHVVNTPVVAAETMSPRLSIASPCSRDEQTLGARPHVNRVNWCIAGDISEKSRLTNQN